jgi:hypothetical protein
MKAASRPGVARSRSLMPTPRHCPRPRTVPPSSPRAAESALSLTPLGYRLVGGGGVAWPIDLSRRLRWGDRPPQWSPGPPRKSARSIAADPHLPSCGRPPPWSSVEHHPHSSAVAHPARSRSRGNQLLPGMCFTNALYCRR